MARADVGTVTNQLLKLNAPGTNCGTPVAATVASLSPSLASQLPEQLGTQLNIPLRCYAIDLPKRATAQRRVDVGIVWVI